ncbi:hypothetical protein CSOJ01_09923 [Colletotrichum sojae]|uniref:Uncharacterized protein n=1 Tax=Colletotrichum sojae TaxID=2175907 RepID=A0A8H6MQ30_9PEZI|nr:hypothetical protein CSOJ01_09923 [Colletotrichum sojae]
MTDETRALFTAPTAIPFSGGVCGSAPRFSYTRFRTLSMSYSDPRLRAQTRIVVNDSSHAAVIARINLLLLKGFRSTSSYEASSREPPPMGSDDDDV